MKENKIKAILVIAVLVILFVLSSFALYYLDNLIIQLICWIYVFIFVLVNLTFIVAFTIGGIIKLLKWLQNNLR